MRTPLDSTAHSMIAALRPRRRRAAFSLAEILIVLAILGLLLGIVFQGGSAMIRKAKSQDTQALIESIEQAITTYESEVSQSRAPNVAGVFRQYPPDNPYVFESGGTLMAGCQIAMGQGNLPAGLMEQRNATGKLAQLADRRHGDVQALLLAMRLRSPGASAILDRIDTRYKESDPGAVFDRGDGSAPIPLVYLVDAWGTPLEYFCTCVCDMGASTPREIASNAFVHAANGEPLIVSYGPDGPDQFSPEFFNDPSAGDTSMVADYFDNGRDLIINHRLNQDNIYSSPVFKERMSTVAQP